MTEFISARTFLHAFHARRLEERGFPPSGRISRQDEWKTTTTTTSAQGDSDTNTQTVLNLVSRVESPSFSLFCSVKASLRATRASFRYARVNGSVDSLNASVLKRAATLPAKLRLLIVPDVSSGRAERYRWNTSGIFISLRCFADENSK